MNSFRRHNYILILGIIFFSSITPLISKSSLFHEDESPEITERFELIKQSKTSNENERKALELIETLDTKTINNKNEVRDTLLHWAIKHNASIAVIAAILGKEPNVNIVNRDGLSALFLAVLYHRIDVIEMLLEYSPNETSQQIIPLTLLLKNSDLLKLLNTLQSLMKTENSKEVRSQVKSLFKNHKKEHPWKVSTQVCNNTLRRLGKKLAYLTQTIINSECDSLFLHRDFFSKK